MAKRASPELPFGIKPTKKGLTDFAKQVSGTTGAPLTIASDAEADAWTSILLTKKAPTFDAGKAAAGLAQLKSFPINHYGSHTLKLPDANMESDQPGFFAMETPDKVLGVVGVAFTKRKFSGIGNAEKSPHHRVISAIYRDGETGEVVSVLDDLLRGGRVTQSMRRLSSSGRNTDACQEIIEAAHAINARRNAGCDVDELSSENKVILWPMADGDYLALTPTTNMALLMETKERIDTRKDANDLVFFPDRAIKIGGTKPQNAGVVASDRGGWFRLLCCDPPPFRSKILHLRGIDEKLKTIKLYRYLPGNERTRLKRDRLINSIVIMVARHLLQDNITVNHESIMKIVRKRSATDLDDYEAGRFADQINLYCLENRS